MTISEILLPEFDQEMAFTRSVLERFPEDRAAWRPHAKSSTLGELAMHLANLPYWIEVALRRTELDLSTYTPRAYKSKADMLQTFDTNVAEGRKVLEAAPDSAMMIPWALKGGGKTVFTLPRTAVLRTFVLSHIIHHRGQLTVYLRMNDVPLPPIYGPSADTRD